MPLWTSKKLPGSFVKIMEGGAVETALSQQEIKKTDGLISRQELGGSSFWIVLSSLSHLIFMLARIWNFFFGIGMNALTLKINRHELDRIYKSKIDRIF